MIYTTFEAVELGKHGMFESSRLKATDIGHLYDALVKADDKEIPVDNGVAIKIGNFTGNGLQEVEATIAGVNDKIAVVGSPAIVKDAFTTAQAQPYNFYNKAGVDAKAYEVVEGDIFAVASYQFTNEAEIAFGKYVQVDGTGKWTIVDEIPETGFVGKVHSVAVGTFYTMVRIECVQNEQIA